VVFWFEWLRSETPSGLVANGRYRFTKRRIDVNGGMERILRMRPNSQVNLVWKVLPHPNPLPKEREAETPTMLKTRIEDGGWKMAEPLAPQHPARELPVGAGRDVVTPFRRAKGIGILTV
jgi:hypothetical protein